jgi:hypothetical protein
MSQKLGRISTRELLYGSKDGVLVNYILLRGVLFLIPYVELTLFLAAAM